MVKHRQGCLTTTPHHEDKTAGLGDDNLNLGSYSLRSSKILLSGPLLWSTPRPSETAHPDAPGSPSNYRGFKGISSNRSDNARSVWETPDHEDGSKSEWAAAIDLSLLRMREREMGKWRGGWSRLGQCLHDPRAGSGQSNRPQILGRNPVLQNLKWAPDLKATAVVSTSGAPLDNCYQEGELRLRTVISPHSITGYEINYKFSNNSTGYMQIVRWSGGFGDFIRLRSYNGQEFGVVNGDVVSATVVGNVITAYKNGVQQGQVTDDTFSTGSTGIGFNLTNDNDGCPGTNGTYGFSSFTALDSTHASF